jgi:hypothetical protein
MLKKNAGNGGQIRPHPPQNYTQPQPSAAMPRARKRTIISQQARAIHKRRRLAEAESQQIAEPVLPDKVENEGEAKSREDDEAEEDGGPVAEEDGGPGAEEDGGPGAEEDDEAEEDDGDRVAMHESLHTYINALQVHNSAAPLPEQPPQTAVDEPGPGSRRQPREQIWPRVSRSKRVEILKAGLADMKKLLKSKCKCPAGQDYTRHLQVKAFICVQLAHTGLGGRCAKTRTELSLQVAQHSLKKSHVARRIRLHEKSWLTKRYVSRPAFLGSRY